MWPEKVRVTVRATIDYEKDKIMSFEQGSISFTIFELPGDLPGDIPALFAAHKAGPLDAATDEPQWGWVTGRHLLDNSIDGASAQRGGCYHLALRQTVRRIPASLLNALCKREEFAYMKANGQDFVSGKVRRQLKEEVVEKYISKMPPSLSGIPMVLEPNERLLYVGATGQKQLDTFVDNFYQATKMEPLPFTPAVILERDFNITESALTPLRIGEAQVSEPQTGRDFLMFLWYYGETVGRLELPQYGEFDLMIEAPLVFSGIGDERGAGEADLKKGDSPLRSAEAKAAVAVGKKLRKAKLTLTRGDQTWSGVFDADRFAFSSFRLPEGEEMNDEERFAERITNIGVFKEALSGYFRLFVRSVLGDAGDKTGAAVRDWARNREAV